MKELIRQVLREYTEPKVTIKIVGWYNGNTPDTIINENYIWKVNPEGCRQSWNFLINYLRDVNPIKESFIKLNKNNPTGKGELLEGLMRIVLTHHYVERLFRLDDPKYTPGSVNNRKNLIINPGLTEGIDLITKNSNQIFKKIMLTPENSRDKLLLEIKSNKGGTLYNIVVNVDEKSISNNVFDLILITQIKGVNFTQYPRKKPNSFIYDN
jgi:hypothetical protein